MGSKRIIYVCYQGQSPQKVLLYDPDVDHHGDPLLGWGAPPAGWDSGGGWWWPSNGIGIDNDNDKKLIYLHLKRMFEQICMKRVFQNIPETFKAEQGGG